MFKPAFPAFSPILTLIKNCDKLKLVAIRGKGVLVMRATVIMACTDCKERNYTTTKNKKTKADRLEFNKYCPRCNKHTLHKETK